MTGQVVPYHVGACLKGQSYRTAFSEGAFTTSLRHDPIELWVNHRGAARVASRTAGTLRLLEGSAGVGFEADIVDPRWAEIIAACDRDGRLRGVSAGFRLDRRYASWSHGMLIYDVARILEASLCLGETWPRFPTWARVAA